MKTIEETNELRRAVIKAGMTERCCERENCPKDHRGNYTGEIIKTYEVWSELRDIRTGNIVTRQTFISSNLSQIKAELQIELDARIARTQQYIGAEKTMGL